MPTDLTERKHWIRWVQASITKYFSDLGIGLEMTFFMEGEPRTDRQTNPTIPDVIELRITGPDISEVSKNYFKLDVNVSIVVETIMDETDLYRHAVKLGLVADKFQSINLFKYGTGPDDDDSNIGCISLDDTDRLEVRQLGQLDENKSVLFSVVEADYVGCFSF